MADAGRDLVSGQVRQNQKRAAAHILESAKKKKKKLKAVGVHDSMRILIPHVDRAKIDNRNILGVVVDVDEGGVYQVLNTVLS